MGFIRAKYDVGIGMKVCQLQKSNCHAFTRHKLLHKKKLKKRNTPLSYYNFTQHAIALTQNQLRRVVEIHVVLLRFCV